MAHRFLSVLILLSIISLLVYTVLLNPAAEPSRASQGPMVVNKTQGCEIEAEIVGNEVSVTVKNNHQETITAFAIGLGNNLRITEDFAYSDVHSGIAPQDVFQKNYPLPASLTGSVPTLYLLTVLLENRGEDGDPIIAGKIKDDRLGQKIQIHRTLRILEKADKPKDLTTLRSDVAAALNASEAETLITLNELKSMDSISSNTKLSDGLRAGLQVGREKMLRRLDALQNIASESIEIGLLELKARSRKLLTKL